MESVVVYIGSEYVIKTPDYDFRQDSLRVSADRAEAERRACRHSAVGVLNMYELDLRSLAVSREKAEPADVVFSSDENGEFVLIRSQRALDALSFVSAGFVSQ